MNLPGRTEAARALAHATEVYERAAWAQALDVLVEQVPAADVVVVDASGHEEITWYPLAVLDSEGRALPAPKGFQTECVELLGAGDSNLVFEAWPSAAVAAKAQLGESTGAPPLDARCVYVADLREYVAGVDPRVTRARRMGITVPSLAVASLEAHAEPSPEHSL